MAAKPPYALIVDTDAGSALALMHLFQVICQKSSEVCTDAVLAREVLQKHSAPTVVVVGRMHQRDAFLRDISAESNAFILVIDRGSSAEEAEDAFLAGADDVVPYGHSLRAIALRLRARLGLLNSVEGKILLEGGANWDASAYILDHADFTAAEAQIAHILISHNGEIVSRDKLSFAIDQRPWDYGDRKFDVHVAKIRKKLTHVFGEDASLSTVRSEGYQLQIDQATIDRLVR